VPGQLEVGALDLAQVENQALKNQLDKLLDLLLHYHLLWLR
jgi:hypothetical protein